MRDIIKKQAGAGRDGGEGHCLAYYSYKDIEKLEKFLESKNKNEKDIASMHLEEVVGYCQTSLSRRKYLLNYFGEYFDSDSGAVSYTHLTLPTKA